MQINEKNKIVYLHFIMSVLVILIHSINNDTKFEKLFSMEFGIGQFAVPLFFVISGFLFFKNVKSISDVKQKINRRIYSLLVPYLLWNLIYFIIFSIKNRVITVSIHIIEDAMFNYTFNPAFWFMFQLILIIALTPVMFYVLKNIYLIVILYLILYMLIIFDINLPYINEDALIYFFSGAVFSRLYSEHSFKFISKKGFVYTLIMFICSFLLNSFANKLLGLSYLFRTTYIFTIILKRLVGSFMIFYFFDLIFKYEKVPSFMYNTFFLYAIHFAIVRGIAYVFRIIKSNYNILSLQMFFEIVIFILSPVICITVSFYLSKVLNDKVPKFYNMLSGNRSIDGRL